MHRSGTTMLTKLLRDAGYWMGDKLEQNSEPQYMIDLNNAILAGTQGKWSAPEKTIEALSSPSQCSKLYDKYKGSLSEISIRRPDMAHKWGWKEPRTTVTLPLWLRHYPDAKVIHIVRNGIDVAASLRSRELLHRPTTTRKVISSWPRRRFGKFSDCRLYSLQFGFDLWKQYLDAFDRFSDQLPASRVLTIRYEDLLKNDLKHLADIEHFLNETPGTLKSVKKAREIDSTRQYAFTRSQALVTFYKKVQTDPLMRRYNYDKITHH